MIHAAMENVISKIVEYSSLKAVSCIYNRETNTEQIKFQLVKLSACREEVQLQVDEAIDKGEKIYTDVQRWLQLVDDVIEEGNKLLEHEGNTKMDCLLGFCPNMMLRLEFGKKAKKWLQDFDELHKQRHFPHISYNDGEVLVPVVPNPHCEAFGSRISTLKKIMDELRNPNTNRLGVYGLGGLGKTTLIKELYRKTEVHKLFEEVIIVFDIRRGPGLERIQKTVAERLGMEIIENETRYGLARRLCDRMKDKMILVILDDVWQSFDLEAVGIPNAATCKVLLTSRNREVFSSFQIRTQRDFQLHVLKEEETWRLFEKIAGDVVKDPDIQTVAMQIARKCGGSPLVVVIVARSLRDISSRLAWRDALRRLMQYDINDQLTERRFSSIEWSYSQLDEELKSLFLLCGISACRNFISLDDLLKYCIGLGWFKQLSTIKTRNSLHSMVEQLKDWCLLSGGNNNDLLRIDDLVLDFAISVAVRGQQVLTQAYGERMREWPNDNFFKSCSMISLPFCNIPKLPTDLDCPELRLFHFWSNNSSLEISRCFFEKMKKLEVLGLTNLSFLSLPLSLQFIRKLHTLCLHDCELNDLALIGQLTSLEVLSLAHSKFMHLPEEIGHLSCLRVLDLNHCTALVVIFPNVLSSLTSLEELRMKNSFNQWEAEEDIGERINARLSELLLLSQLTTLAIHIRDVVILPAGLFTK